MNKRIQELLKQATKAVDPENRVWVFSEVDQAKFAELIVRECLDIMSKTSKEAEERFTYMGDDVPTVVHQMNIEKHFGVEQ